jgi:hypothetical protein
MTGPEYQHASILTMFRLRGVDVLAALAVLERTRDNPDLLAHLIGGLQRHVEAP